MSLSRFRVVTLSTVWLSSYFVLLGAGPVDAQGDRVLSPLQLVQAESSDDPSLGPRLPGTGAGESEAAPSAPGIPDAYRDRAPHADADTGVEPGGEGYVPPEWYGRRIPYRAGYFYPHPWFAPQTIPYKHELVPPPVAAGEPRLGLLYNYPYAWQMGIQMPFDTSPLDLPELPPYTGVVEGLKAAQREAAAAQLPEEPAVLALLAQGRYREAGKLLMPGFARGKDARYALLLAEAFVGMGKYAHAELLVEHAYELAGGETEALEAAPGRVSNHFASPGDFARHLHAISSQAKRSVLTRYLRLRYGEEVAAARRAVAVR